MRSTSLGINPQRRGALKLSCFVNFMLPSCSFVLKLKINTRDTHPRSCMTQAGLSAPQGAYESAASPL